MAIRINRVYTRTGDGGRTRLVGGAEVAKDSRRVEAYGNIAHVWSTYESRRGREMSDPYSRGIASIQLLKDGDRWWIISVFWDYERPDNKLPEKYQKSPKE
jgi:hypothetical protein